MKFWNKQKEVRERCWSKITLSRDPHLYPLYPSRYKGWNRRTEFDSMKQQLQLTGSSGKFYMNIMNKEIWFEYNSDAVYFSLRWL